jgi:hypothetical protein
MAQAPKIKEPQFYRYKGSLYVYLDEVQSKHPVTREWSVSALYADEFGNKYTRDITEFYERFTEEKFHQIKNLEEVHKAYIHGSPCPIN